RLGGDAAHAAARDFLDHDGIRLDRGHGDDYWNPVTAVLTDDYTLAASYREWKREVLTIHHGAARRWQDLHTIVDARPEVKWQRSLQCALRGPAAPPDRPAADAAALRTTRGSGPRLLGVRAADAAAAAVAVGPRATGCPGVHPADANPAIVTFLIAF